MIFFVFNGSLDDLHANSLTRFGEWHAYQLTDNLLVGRIETTNHNARTALAALDARLVPLPGPGGSVNQKHAAALATLIPGMKKGDAFRTALSAVYAASGDERFNPDNY